MLGFKNSTIGMAIFGAWIAVMFHIYDIEVFTVKGMVCVIITVILCVVYGSIRRVEK